MWQLLTAVSLNAYDRLRHQYFGWPTKKPFRERLRLLRLCDTCRGNRRPGFGVMSQISMPSLDDLDQGAACSALAMDPNAKEARVGQLPLPTTA